jgi:hypothetical protein
VGAAGAIAHAHDRQIPAVEACQQVRDAVEAIDAHRLEVGAQYGFDGAFPTLVDPQLLRDPWQAIERLRLEPLRDPARGFAERSLLQRFGRDPLSLYLLQTGTQRIERLTLFALAFPRR